MAKIKVALVEDDAFLAKMYITKLTMEGFQVLHAADGAAGVELVKAQNPAVLLLDILLPKLDGWEVLTALKQDPATRNIPVIMLSNLGQEEDIQKGVELGAVDYLIKAHFVPTEVINKVRQVIKRS